MKTLKIEGNAHHIEQVMAFVNLMNRYETAKAVCKEYTAEDYYNESMGAIALAEHTRKG